MNLLKNSKYKDLIFIISLFVLTRILTWYLAFTSFQLLYPINKDRYVWNHGTDKKLDIWAVWDSGYYLDIAKNGYSTNLGTSPETLNQANYAFHPLYPILIRYFTLLTNNPVMSGIVISNVSLFIASLLLYLLVKEEFSASMAKGSLLFLYAFPTAFIFTSVYTEALFLMLTMAAFYFSRRDKYLIAGVFGGLAALTKNVGVVLLIPLMLELVQSKKDLYLKLANLIKLLLIPTGTFFYMLYLKKLTGNFFASIEIQKTWGRQLGNPVLYLLEGFSSNLYQHQFTALFVLAVIIVSLVMYRYLRTSFWVYTLLLVFIPLSTALASMPRYVLIAFPFYVFAGVATEKFEIIRNTSLMALALIQGMMLVFWVTGHDLLM